MTTQADLDPSKHTVVTDERVRKQKPFQRLLVRPEIGALFGAIIIFVFFAIVAPPFRSPEALATVLYASSTIGIMAIGVSLLMIGGEFDLSAGVAVTFSSLAARVKLRCLAATSKVAKDPSEGRCRRRAGRRPGSSGRARTRSMGKALSPWSGPFIRYARAIPSTEGTGSRRVSQGARAAA